MSDNRFIFTSKTGKHLANTISISIHPTLYPALSRYQLIIRLKLGWAGAIFWTYLWWKSWHNMWPELWHNTWWELWHNTWQDLWHNMWQESWHNIWWELWHNTLSGNIKKLCTYLWLLISHNKTSQPSFIVTKLNVGNQIAQLNKLRQVYVIY